MRRQPDQRSAAPSKQKSSRNRWTLLVLAALFLAPMIAALLWRPSGYVNSGDLVEPPRPLTEIGVRTLGGQSFNISELRSKWTLVHFASSCDQTCEAVLSIMRRVRLAQSKNARRVQNVLVVSDVDTSTVHLSTLPEILVLTAGAEALDRLAVQFNDPFGDPFSTGRVYVVDPLGNLMMSFSADADPSDMRKDLVRLLKVSQIG